MNALLVNIYGMKNACTLISVHKIDLMIKKYTLVYLSVMLT